MRRELRASQALLEPLRARRELRALLALLVLRRALRAIQGRQESVYKVPSETRAILALQALLSGKLALQVAWAQQAQLGCRAILDS